MQQPRIDVYSHHVAVSLYDYKVKLILTEFLTPYIEMSFRKTFNRTIVEPKRVYAAATKDRREMRFHIHCMDELLSHFARYGYRREQLDIVVHSLPKAAPAKFEIKNGKEPRDYQVPLIEYLVQDGVSKILTLQTGGGKTYCALAALAQIRERCVLVLRGMYVDRWLNDLCGPKSTFKLRPGKDVIVARGSKQLIALIDQAKRGELKAMFIIIPNKTFANMITHYEDNDRDTSYYGCAPQELFEILKAGVRLIDEVHQDFHLNFKLDLYTHVAKTISLSATLDSDNRTVENMYQVVWPMQQRVNNGALKKYIAVTALYYGMDHQLKPLATMQRGMYMYSHTAFEDDILKQSRRLMNYLDMIAWVTQDVYIAKAGRKQKFLIFAATVEMCERIRVDLTRRYPTHTVCKYTAEEDYNEAIENDIIVSTLISSGTAVDIPGLIACLMTTAIGSKPANIQAVGRLREIPGVTPCFYYLVCRDIPKHMEYHQRKIEILAPRVLSHNALELDFKI
jgi:superfamily II DNA or RNA helicase